MDIFLNIGKPIQKSVNNSIDYLVVNYGDQFETFSNSILTLVVYLEKGLKAVPAPLFIVAVMLIAYAIGRKWALTIGVGIGLYILGGLGLWEKSMQTIAIMLVAVLISLAIGLPLGVLSSRSSRFRAILSPVLDLMQTIPSFVYLIPAAMLFGLGKVPAILATVIYATPPLIRLVDLGIREVDKEVVEACQAFGGTRLQTLTGVQIPLALPSIMQGINQTMMMSLAMVVVASMIGARGVGETVLIGLQRNDAGMGFIGGIAIVILAIVFDRITQAAGMRLQAHRN
ncbi:MAG: proline/glycine betaine ABC transporter permease [Gammaproteobacteria bacterium]|nr:proline/glycine betaine ABC transporter permease [Gammaproteobacteria bacterium]